MSQTEPALRNISDTARWAALYRAAETERPDALFRDPFARRLGAERREQIAATMQDQQNAWAWVTRTYLFDQLIARQVERGADMVINLAAGLDARPYRMALPASLRWIEVDLDEILAYKEDVLADEKPACSLERVRLDLTDEDARRRLFERWGSEARQALVVTEGLLIYLTADQVSALGRDLAAPDGFRHWIVDPVSPGLLAMLQRQLGAQLDEASAPLRFGPEEGPEFFKKCGWHPVDVRSILKTAARAKRVSLWMRLLAKLPESTGRQGSRPWSAVCLLARNAEP